LGEFERSERSRTKRTKFGQRVLVYRIRDARKMGREQKGLAPFFTRGPNDSVARPQFRSLRTGTLATQAKFETVLRLRVCITFENSPSPECLDEAM